MSSSSPDFHKVWIEQCAATEDIREHFGLESALLTCPPKTEPVLVLDWQNRKGGQINGQEGVQTRANHQQTA